MGPFTRTIMHYEGNRGLGDNLGTRYEIRALRPFYRGDMGAAVCLQAPDGLSGHPGDAAGTERQETGQQEILAG